MSETVTVSSVEELYAAIQAKFGTAAPDKIAVVDQAGDVIATYPATTPT